MATTCRTTWVNWDEGTVRHIHHDNVVWKTYLALVYDPQDRLGFEMSLGFLGLHYHVDYCRPTRFMWIWRLCTWPTRLMWTCRLSTRLMRICRLCTFAFCANIGYEMAFFLLQKRNRSCFILFIYISAIITMLSFPTKYKDSAQRMFSLLLLLFSNKDWVPEWNVESPATRVRFPMRLVSTWER